MEKGLTIGRLARRAGVHLETIRYYQRRGLLAEPPRPPGGVRRYPAQFAERIRFIKRAQQLGFSLKEIAELLELGDGRCADVRGRAEAKLAQVEAQLRDLERLRATLADLVRACRANRPAGPCPVVESLAAGGSDPVLVTGMPGDSPADRD